MRIADISEQMWELLFAVRLSIRYHDRRKRFFAFLHRTTSGLAVVFGSAAMAALIGNLPKSVGLAAAGVVTIASALDLVIGFTAAANLHHDLKGRFIELEREIIDAHDDSMLSHYQRRRLEIEKDEPPIYRALSTLCHNDIVRSEYSAQDAQEHFIHVPWWKRISAHLAW